MKKIILPLLVLGLISISACKKSSTTTGGGASPATITAYDGTLEASKTNFSFSAGVIDSSYSCNAYFYGTPQNVPIGDFLPQYLTSAGNVFMDTIKTQYQNNYYADSTGLLNLSSTVKWNIHGSTAAPQFTYSYAPVWPTYTHYNLLPDTIHLGQSVTLQLSGMSNSNQVTVQLYNLTTGTIQGTSFSYIAANTNYVFTSSSLSGFSSGQQAELLITLYNTASVQTFSGKKYLFYNRYSYVKFVYFK